MSQDNDTFEIRKNIPIPPAFQDTKMSRTAMKMIEGDSVEFSDLNAEKSAMCLQKCLKKIGKSGAKKKVLNQMTGKVVYVVWCVPGRKYLKRGTQ